MFGLDDLDLHMRMIGSDMYVSGGLLQLMGQFDPSFTQFAGRRRLGARRRDEGFRPDAIISQMSGAANPADALAMLDGVELPKSSGPPTSRRHDIIVGSPSAAKRWRK